MSYAILHMQKLKQPAIKGIQIHNQREKESQTNPDIDEERTHLNYDLVNPGAIDYDEKINKMIEEGVTTNKAIRKDAVRVASFLVTSDSEYFQNLSEKEEKRFFKSAYEFFAEEYGDKNIAYASVHKDEKTPHMHVGFVPITEDGRLSAKDFFGKKQQLAQLQDKFHEHMVNEGFDLERGVASGRKHVTSAKYKALTFQNLEQEAKEKYERMMTNIHEIEDKTKSVESIEAKKGLGGSIKMKEPDYNLLVDYAKNGVVFEKKAEDLERELEKSQKEVLQLKTEMQIGQSKVRYYYQDIEKNLDVLSDEKATEKAKELNLDIFNKYKDLSSKFKNAVEKYQLQITIMENMNQKINTLTIENGSYQNENRDLKEQNKTLEAEKNQWKEKYLKISNELSAFKEKVRDVLRDQVDRFKTFMRIHNISREIIKDMDDKRERFVEKSMKKLEESQKEKTNDKQLELGE